VKSVLRFIEEKNRGNKIHLILLDYRLGDMLGSSVAKKIKDYNGTIIILISAFDLDYTLVKELEENNFIADYIEKPIHMSSLLERVTDIIS
jgi:DNA-binding response OmpR family regulator